MICSLCPRRCGAERTETTGGGFCAMPAMPVVARAALHQWEEPVISGTRGSGAVFFSGCSLRCVFCQNHDISAGGFGRPVTVARLREIFRELVYFEAQGSMPGRCRRMSRLYELLDTLLLHCTDHGYASGEERSVGQTDEEKLVRILSFVNAHYNDNVSLHELAESMYTSTSTLSRFFKRQTGLRPSVYRNRKE